MNIHQMMSALFLVLQSCTLALPSVVRSSDSGKPRQSRSSSKSARRFEHSASLLSSKLLSSVLLAESAETGLVQIEKTPIPQFKKKKRQSKRNGLKTRRKYHMSRKIEQKHPVTTHNDVSGSGPVSSRRQSDLHTASGNAPRRSKNRRTREQRRQKRKRCRKNRKNRKNNKMNKKNSRKNNKKNKQNKKRHARRPKGCKGKKSKRKNGKKITKTRSRRHKTHKSGNKIEDEEETREVRKTETTTVREVSDRSMDVVKLLGSAVPLRTQVKPSASTRMPTPRELSEGFKSSVPLSHDLPDSHTLEKEEEMRDLEFLLNQKTIPLQTQQPSREKLSPENHDSSKDSVDVSRSRSSIDDTFKLRQGYASSVPLQRRKRGTGFSSLSLKLLRIGSSDNKETVPFIFQIQTALKSKQSELSWLVRRHFSSSRSDGLLDKLLT